MDSYNATTITTTKKAGNLKSLIFMNSNDEENLMRKSV